MKLNKLTVIWMSSATSRSRVFRVPHVLFYICLGFFVISWALLGTGGYLGRQLYRDSIELRVMNSYLRQKEKDLDALRQAMEQIKVDESLIRSFLGLDNAQKAGSGLGQGGESSPDLSTINPSDAMTVATELSPGEARPYSIVRTAQNLKANLQELVETMREQKRLLGSTPSIIPVKTNKYWLSSGFGWRRNPFTGAKEFHNGLDICSRRSTPIVAPANGIVAKVGMDKYLGNFLMIDHGRYIVTTYGHLSKLNVDEGQSVKRGEVIALMGNTGLSTGNHLHYMVKVNKKYVNPLHYILNGKREPLLDLPLKAGSGLP